MENPTWMEEFQEADLMWPEDRDSPDNRTLEWDFRHGKSNSDCYEHSKESLPMEIPASARLSWKLQDFTYQEMDGNYDEEFARGAGDDDEMVPPHLMVSRRLAAKMVFSVCTGNGRTLKGRDLSQVRNSILRLTGFLEV